MWEKIVGYFVRRHILTNFICVAVFIGGIFFWYNTSKEAMPDITFDIVRVSASYPGASGEEVEHFVTRPLEDAVKGLDGVYRVSSTSSAGRSSITVELEQNYREKNEAIAEIKSAVLDVNLPDEIADEPRVGVFKTSKMAILDIALVDTEKHLLDFESRERLQAYVLALENQLLNLSQVNSVDRSGYLQEEIRIMAHPEKLTEYRVPLNAVMREIKNNHVRQPAGSIESKEGAKVTLISELDNIKKLENLIIQGGFEGQTVRLKEIADVARTYEKNESISKINGHEGVVLRVVKGSSYGILEAVDAAKKVVNNFQKSNLAGSSVKALMINDGSTDVKNRLSIVGMNGTIGLIFILATLFIFLDFKTGVWVAMGIPFTFCFTMIFASLLGYTINNITLVAVIIVMGMVVDDAIVVAENISRMHSEGTAFKDAVIKGTIYVLMPIIASIVTTCVAFMPLLFFSGRFARMARFIPVIIFLMLGGSLFESIFILPGHLSLKIPRTVKLILSLGTLPLIEKYSMARKQKRLEGPGKRHWFYRVEDVYGRLVEKVLPRKWIVFSLFIGLLVFSGYIFTHKMKFVIFPNEETEQISVVGKADPDVKRYETAELSKQVEDVISEYVGKEVIAFRTMIARSRRGGAVEENRFSMNVEIVSKEERKKSANQLIAEWNEKTKGVKGLEELSFRKSHFGQSSGSPIEVVVQENDDIIRSSVVDRMKEEMQKYPALLNVEVERPLREPEYRVDLNADKIKRLGISPVDIGSTFRAALEGVVLYRLSHGNEEIDVRFTIAEKAKDDIDKVLNIPVENKGNYLIPLRNIVNIKKVATPSSIVRQDFRRTTSVYADISETAGLTPLEIAEHFEGEVFPDIVSKFPTAAISFGGEVRETRESKSNFFFGIIMTVFLIYIILALLFNSLYKPFIIMFAIPFGVVGIILAFWMHGISLFGFFAAIGALGLAGVVVNDSIIMLDKLDKEYDPDKNKEESGRQIADIAKTRLRAVLLTTFTTVAGLFPTAYGVAGYDAMLAEMMLALGWGLLFGTMITLFLIPSLYGLVEDIRYKLPQRQK